MGEEWYEGAHYKRKFTFRFGDCDLSKKASLFSIMKLLSEIAGDDYEGRGLGHSALQEQGQAFIVSKMNLSFVRTPLFTEKIVASTWERFVKGPFFYRDYEIHDEDGGLLVAGSSQWLIVNPVSREIVRPDSLVLGKRENDNRKSACPECCKIKIPEALPVIGTRPIYYSDIDGNEHVNNAVYGKIASDFLPEKLRSKDIKTFFINFNAEIKADEILDIYGAETEDGYVVQGGSKKKINFSCKFGY